MIKLILMNGKFILTFILSNITMCLFYSCSEKSEKIISVSVSTSGRGFENTNCFAYEVRNDLNVFYFGGTKMDNSGCFHGYFAQIDWITLEKLSKIVVNNIQDTVLSASSTEDNYFDLILKSNKRKVRILGYYSNAPSEVQKLVTFFVPKLRNLKLKKSKCHNFEVKAYLDKRH